MQDPTAFGPDYWVKNLTSVVKFRSAVSRLLETIPGAKVSVEVGPHCGLSGPFRQISSGLRSHCTYIASQKRGQDTVASFLAALGQLFQANVPIDFHTLFAGGKAVSSLPTYPWDHTGPSFWYESRLSKDWRGRHFPQHPLLGLRSLESTDIAPSWRNVLRLRDNPWLADHKIENDVVFPFSGYIAMAGESMRQLQSGMSCGYHVRNLVVRSALVLNDLEAVELVTSMHRKRLTNIEDSDQWFEFSIMSLGGSGSWVKHCDGEARHSNATIPVQSSAPLTLTRYTSTTQFYRSMKHIGYNWGPEFQRVSKLISSSTKNMAEGEVVRRDCAEAIHPVEIDACLQILLLATAKGMPRKFDRLHLPTSVQDVIVAPSIRTDTNVTMARAWLDELGNTVETYCSGRICIRMKGVDFKVVSEPVTATWEGNQALARSLWVPHFDFLDHAPLLAPSIFDHRDTVMYHELVLLYLLEESDTISGLSPCQPYLQSYRDWLHDHLEMARRGTFPLIDNPTRLVLMSIAERHALMESHFSVLMSGKRKALAIGAKRLCDQAADIFTGSVEPIEVLQQDDLLTQIYNCSMFDFGQFTKALALDRPKLRILEVGAGTGGSTSLILRDLLLPGSEFPLYSKYTYTDISSGFFPQAKKRFEAVPNMEYRVFDISKSPMEQGFQNDLGQYDLVIASFVVHATPCLRASLANLRPLLRPEGMLVLAELTPDHLLSNYIFGHIAGWWLGADDGRTSVPNVTADRWDKELRAAGYTGVERVVYDDKPPFQHACVMVSRPFDGNKEPDTAHNSVILLCSDVTRGIGAALSLCLERAGLSVAACCLENVQSAFDASSDDVISCLDLEMACTGSLNEADFLAMKDLMRLAAAQRRKILWLSRPAQINTEDPTASIFMGLARTARSELGTQVFSLEIDRATLPFEKLVLDVFKKIQTLNDDGEFDPDTEYAVLYGQICVQRCHPFSVQTEVRKHAESTPVDICPRAFRAVKPGSLEFLQWQEEDPMAGPSEDEVLIETRAVGLNYRDVLLALGVLPTDSPGSVALGFDAAGIVTRTGKAVQSLAVGTRVMCLAEAPCLATSIKVQQSLVVPIPDNVTFEQAATIPMAFATVIYSLLDVANLRKGQTVLIHSACGGVGLAALQICEMVGAVVYATVGTAEKTEYLKQHHGIPEHRIFNSRDAASFTEGIRRETLGQGVDLVLNTLTGELLHESWKCVGVFGKMIDLTQKDARGSGHLDMLPFLHNRSYHGVDLAPMWRTRPWMINE